MSERIPDNSNNNKKVNFSDNISSINDSDNSKYSFYKIEITIPKLERNFYYIFLSVFTKEYDFVFNAETSTYVKYISTINSIDKEYFYYKSLFNSFNIPFNLSVVKDYII